MVVRNLLQLTVLMLTIHKSKRKGGTTDGNDAVNLNQLNEVKNASNTTVEGKRNINVNSTVDPNTKAKTYKVALKDNVTLGSGNNAININGTTGIIKAGDGANAVTINGTNGTINSGKVTVNGTAGTVNNLTNITWDGKTSQVVKLQQKTN